jgi:CheY-like chemotaxis protein
MTEEARNLFYRHRPGIPAPDGHHFFRFHYLMGKTVETFRSNGKSHLTVEKTILFVDDDEDDREIFKSVLKDVHPQFGFVPAKDGLDALNLLSTSPPPVCIYVDVNMPNMNGLEFLRAVQLHRIYSKIPVFVLSSLYKDEDKGMIRNLGAVDYMKKPDNYEDFVKLLRSCFMEHIR